jgi:predicted DsbA family dithiol-disulfide isomerase
MTEIDVRPGTVRVFTDVACGWAMISLTRFYRARARLGLDDEVRVDFGLFLLEDINRLPIPKRFLDAEIPVIGALEPGVRFQMWQGLPSNWPVTTLLANEAVHAAKRQSLRASEQLDYALRTAFFCDSRCISMRHVVLDVAAHCDQVDLKALDHALDEGLVRAEMMRGYHEHVEQVQGSPHFFLADGTDVHNPGVTFHWIGDPGKGFPYVDSDDPTVVDRLVRQAAGQPVGA